MQGQCTGINVSPVGAFLNMNSIVWRDTQHFGNLCSVDFCELWCSARSDQYDKAKEHLLSHVVESFRIRSM